jgi:two-component system, cell cycle response regulator DivK
VTAPRALGLSDKQLALLQRAAASLPVGERDHFLQSVAAHLTGAPTDDAVTAAINAALDAAAASLKRSQHEHVPTPLPPLASQPRGPGSFFGAGFTFIVATDGLYLQGVAMAASEQPDLILMDLTLPNMDGGEATRRIKADPATKRIPVIALTANAMAGDREKALAAGCDDFDTKPVELERLLGKIRALARIGTASFLT